MNSAIYRSMQAIKNLINNSNINTNNLANASTDGFKSQYQIIYKKKKENFLNFLSTKQPFCYHNYFDLSNGPFLNTNRSLDIAIKNKEGWIVVEYKKDKIGYTKNGHIKIDAKGNLMINNNLILGKNGYIKIPNNIIPIIQSDGTIDAYKNSSGKKIFQYKIDKIRTILINKNTILRKKKDVFVLKKKNKEKYCKQENINIEFASKVLEKSNVNVIESMVKMINYSRNFDLLMKTISSCNENEKKSNSLLSINDY